MTLLAVTIPTPAHHLDGVFVLHARPLRAGADLERTGRFEQDVWRLEPAIVQQHQRASALDFTTLPHQYRLVAKELCYALLSGPLPPAETRGAVLTVRIQFSRLKRFLTWMDTRPGAGTLTEVDASDLEAYARWLLTAVVSVTARDQARSAVRLFWRYRSQLQTDGLSFDPLSVDGWSQPNPTRTRENATDRIPEPVCAALLAWALRFIDDFAPDILHADTQWRRKRRRPSGATRDDVRLLLAEYVADNRPLPGHQGHVNINALAAEAGACVPVVQRCQPDIDAAAIRVGIAAVSVFAGPITGRLDGQPWIEGIGSFHRGSNQTLACLVRMLQASCYLTIAYLSGMRDSEIKHLRRGCLRTHRDSAGVPYRHSVASLAFKGERDSTGVTATWIIGAPAARAITVLEQLQPPDVNLLFTPMGHGPGSGMISIAANTALVSSSTNHQLNALTAWINDYCTNRQRTDGVPDHNGAPWRLKTSQFRRTLAWYIARRPGGAIAGAIQYRHLSIQMFEGYAGTSDSGFRAEVESEQALARGEHLLAMIDAHEHTALTGPAASEAVRRLQDFDTRSRFQGLVITDSRRLQRLMARADPAIYPGTYTTCVFDHVKAGNRRPTDPTRPDLAHCRPLQCRNVVLTADNLAAWQTERDRLDQLLSAHPPLPPMLHQQLVGRRDEIIQFLGRYPAP